MDIYTLYYVAWFTICPLIGGLIGIQRRRFLSGVVWGLILGPIGWLLVLLLADCRPKCPECKSPLNDGATRCHRCGCEVARHKRVTSKIEHEALPPKTNQKQYYALINGVEKGPFTYEVLQSEIDLGQMDSTVLCASPGDPEWRPFSQLSQRD